MNVIETCSTKALLLINHQTVFETMKSALEEVRCEIPDEFDAFVDADLVVMDSFYLKAGLADFVKTENENIFTLLVLRENEMREINNQLVSNVDDALVLELSQSREDLFSSVVDWFKDAWNFSKLLSAKTASENSWGLI